MRGPLNGPVDRRPPAAASVRRARPFLPPDACDRTPFLPELNMNAIEPLLCVRGVPEKREHVSHRVVPIHADQSLSTGPHEAQFTFFSRRGII